MNRDCVIGIGLSLVSMAGLAQAQCSSTASKEGQVMAASFAHSQAADKDIVDTAVAAGSFKTLAAALKAAGWVEALKGKGPFTVFAPTDEAFAKLPKGTVEMLLKPENKAKLASILTYHVVPMKVLAADVRTMPAPTVNGQRIDVVVKNGKVMTDQATVVMADVLASNGVIHAIDTVLMPSEATIVQTAVKAGSFKTLAMLLEKADLVGALEGEGPFTVFAPTDTAFAAVPKETLDSLLKPENAATLKKILLYHVVQGRAFSDVAAKGWTGPTLAGVELTTRSEGGSVFAGNAKVVTPDIDTANGVIHVIDKVLMPK